MDTMQAIMRGQLAAARGAEKMVFDWHKAARLILQHGAKHAEAGLKDDWGYTGGCILHNKMPLGREDSYTYLSSNWARPEIELEPGGVMECWCWQHEHPDWNENTFWPESALAILRGGEA